MAKQDHPDAVDDASGMSNHDVDASVLPPRLQLPDAYPPEDYGSLAREYPWLTVAAGLGLGLLSGTVLPKGATGRLGRRAAAAAAFAVDVGLASARRAGDLTQNGKLATLERLGTGAALVRAGARRGGSSLRGLGAMLAREVAIRAVNRRKASRESTKV